MLDSHRIEIGESTFEAMTVRQKLEEIWERRNKRPKFLELNGVESETVWVTVR